jgi:hypothetical protein
MPHSNQGLKIPKDIVLELSPLIDVICRDLSLALLQCTQVVVDEDVSFLAKLHETVQAFEHGYKAWQGNNDLHVNQVMKACFC